VTNGLHVVADSLNSSGQKIHTESTPKFDGKDYPFNQTLDGKPDPSAAGETVSAKKIDDYTYEATLKVNGRVVQNTRTVISKDGKMETITQTGTTTKGVTYNNSIVREKQ
jgi:hypothetical protein